MSSDGCDESFKTEFTWKIENFNMLSQEVTILDSPLLSVGNPIHSIWYLQLIFTRKTMDASLLRCKIVFQNCSHIRTLEIGKYHKEVLLLCPKGKVFKLYWTTSILSEDVLIHDHCLSKGVLTLRCKFRFFNNVSTQYVDDLTELSRKIGDLYKNKQFANLTLCTSDREFLIHKFLLRNRAPKLFEELGLQNKNIKNERVKVDNISSEVLQTLLHYLYSGNVGSVPVENQPEFYDVVKNNQFDELSSEVFSVKSSATLTTHIEVATKNIVWKFDVSCLLNENSFSKYVDFDYARFLVKVQLTKGDDYCVNTSIRCISSSEEDVVMIITPSFGMNENNLEQYSGKKLVFSLKNKQEHRTLKHIYRKTLSGTNNLYFETTLKVSRGKRTWRSTDFYLTALERPSIFGITSLRNNLKKLFFRNKDFEGCDISLHFQNVTTFAHKAILAAWSPVFAGMFQHNMAETNCSEIKITDIEEYVGQSMLGFMYSGDFIETNLQTTMKLYYAADKYQVSSLFSKCSIFMASHLKENNACEIVVLADQHNDGKLLDAVQQFICIHRNNVLRSSEWLSIVKENPLLASKVLLDISGSLLVETTSE